MIGEINDTIKNILQNNLESELTWRDIFPIVVTYWQKFKLSNIYLFIYYVSIDEMYQHPSSPFLLSL